MSDSNLYLFFCHSFLCSHTKNVQTFFKKSTLFCKQIKKIWSYNKEKNNFKIILLSSSFVETFPFIVAELVFEEFGTIEVLAVSLSEGDDTFSTGELSWSSTSLSVSTLVILQPWAPPWDLLKDVEL